MVFNSSSISNSTNKDCETNKLMPYILTGILIIRFFLLVPLCSFILYLGWLQWRRQNSFRSSSHSDIFTYNVAVVELVSGLGSIVYLLGENLKQDVMISVGRFLFSLIFKVVAFFHILTCVERYLAVVHPITYMKLRNSRGVQIRNLSILSVWLVGLVWSYMNISNKSDLYLSLLSLSALSLVIVSFCSVSVLCVLIGPGPGEGGGKRESVDPMKQRAFFTIMTIMAVLSFWFLGFFFTSVLVRAGSLRNNVTCVLRAIGTCFSLPSHLVLPLLYLHRAGRGLSCCRCR